MRRWVAAFVVVVLTLGTLAPAAQAAVEVRREGSENPMLEVAKSTFWGGLLGVMVGGALALATEDNDNDGDIVRWSFVGGVFLGLGVGMYHVATRPSPTALLEFQDGSPSLHAVLPQTSPDGGLKMHLVGVRF